MKPSWKPSRWLGTKNFRIEPKPESPAAGLAKVLHPSDNSARSGSYAWDQQGRVRPSLSGPTREGTVFDVPSFLRSSRSPTLSHRDRRRFLHVRLAQKLRCLLRRCGIDVKPRPPLESGGLGQLWHEFDVPVIVVVGRILHRRGVNHKVVGWIIQNPVRADQQVLQRARQIFE